MHKMGPMKAMKKETLCAVTPNAVFDERLQRRLRRRWSCVASKGLSSRGNEEAEIKVPKTTCEERLSQRVKRRRACTTHEDLGRRYKKNAGRKVLPWDDRALRDKVKEFMVKELSDMIHAKINRSFGCRVEQYHGEDSNGNDNDDDDDDVMVIDYVDGMRGSVRGDDSLDPDPKFMQNIPVDRDVSDPDFKLFLQNAALDGDVIVVKINLGNKAPIVIRYSESDDEQEDCLNSSQNPMTNSDVLDPSYEDYLSILLNNNGNVENIREDSGDSDVEIIEIQSLADGDHNPFVSWRFSKVINIDDEVECGPHAKEHSQFREKVMNVFRKPFDEDELEDLLFQTFVRKPIVRTRMLRGQDVDYISDTPGKSHLDHYPDVHDKIRLFEDNRAKILNLMRGLFFYLENICHPGAFKPWEDKDCLKAM